MNNKFDTVSHKPISWYPNILQATLASLLLNPREHTEPQTLEWHISKRPLFDALFKRILPSVQFDTALSNTLGKHTTDVALL